ncbi:MAG: MBL fold metallo-hydrolase [Pseudomonadota bacterium]
MSELKVETIAAGDENGNHMMIRWRLPSGLEVISLPTKNFYGGEWDLGPTWNFLVLADRPFLIDAGRFGRTEDLLRMLARVGLKGQDLEFIVLSHGHEDHDGGAAEFSKRFGTPIKSHPIYEKRIRFYPDLAPAGARPDFPAACWHCFMPESFSRANCLTYHQDRGSMPVTVVEDNGEVAPGVSALHVPGHSPDSLALVVGTEAIFSGDVVLPEITPFPTTEKHFTQEKAVLGDEFGIENKVFGLKVFLGSLARLKKLGQEHPDLAVFPAHRFFYGNKWNDLNLVERIDGILSHHLDRGGDILKILSAGPHTARELTVRHFRPDQLQGLGVLMAENEIVSHLELMQGLGDIARSEDGRYRLSGNGNGFAALLESALA